MTFRGFILAVVASFTLTTSSILPSAAAGDTFDQNEKTAIETIIHDYLLANPEVLFQSIQKYQQRQEISKKSKIKQTLSRLSPVLKNNPGSPVTGNPQGDVTVIEFFDYRCGYCRKVFPTIKTLLKEDRNIRYVFKEFPILGPMSVVATRASLAMWSIDPAKYMTFHTSIMTSRGQLDEARILKFAEKAGYDAMKVRRKMNDPAIEKEIADNSRLAAQLGINGTPAFVIGDHVIPGAVDLATLKQLVLAARK